ENPVVVENDLRELIAGAAAAHPAARVTIRRILLAEPLKATPEAKRMSELVCRHATEVFGEPVRSTGVPLYT
ncbi:hypothetical protein, partial [Stenotrophomonas maltophilia]